MISLLSVEIPKMSAEHKKILDDELASYKKNPILSSSWEDIKTRIQKRKYFV